MPATTSQKKAKKSKKTKQKENREQKTGTHAYREHKGRKKIFVYK